MKKSVILNSLNSDFEESLKIEELEKRLEMLILKPISDFSACDDHCDDHSHCDWDDSCDIDRPTCGNKMD